MCIPKILGKSYRFNCCTFSCLDRFSPDSNHGANLTCSSVSIHLVYHYKLTHNSLWIKLEQFVAKFGIIYSLLRWIHCLWMQNFLRSFSFIPNFESYFLELPKFDNHFRISHDVPGVVLSFNGFYNQGEEGRITGEKWLSPWKRIDIKKRISIISWNWKRYSQESLCWATDE